MTTTKQQYFEIAAFPLTGPSVYRALVTKYVLMVAYATMTAVFGVAAVTDVAGAVYGVVFPLCLVASSLAALVGVVRSRHTGHTGLEYLGTCALLAGMVGYSAAIIWRSLVHPIEYLDTLPAFMLPIMLSVYPFFRVVNILRRARAADVAEGGDDVR